MSLRDDCRDARRWMGAHRMRAGSALTAIGGAVALAGAATAWYQIFGLRVVIGLALALFALSLGGWALAARARRNRRRGRAKD